jgi:hypothetical protein
VPTLQQRGGLLHAPGWLRPWQFRRRITIDNSAQAETLRDFPLLVKLDSTRISYANTQPAGADLRFTDATGALLAYDIEKWDTAGTSYAWVRVPAIAASSSTDIWMYYSNPATGDGQNKTGTWRTEYKAVYHLGETGNGTAGEYKDSTTNANNGRGGGGTTAAVPTATTSGAIGTAQTFDGTNDYIAVTNAASLYVSGAFSLGAWVYRTANPSDGYGGYIFSDYNSTGNACSFALKIGGGTDTSVNTVSFGWENTSMPLATSSATLALNTWTHVAATWDGTTRRLYINGAADGTNATSQSRSDNGGNTGIGRPGAANGQYCPAAIDEVFLYSGALSAAWIAATYKSQADTYCTFGSEE